MITTPPSYKEMINMTYHVRAMTTPNNAIFRLSLLYMSESYKVLLKSVKMNAAPLHSNYILKVETYLLNVYVAYSENRVVQNHTRVLRKSG